ncbi:MAG: substrate-binding domain-containing protein [Oscillospiraceae bacterium]|nr:substrate-binding domain-containing protein [Oscillospiraceae bacterium]
MKKTLCALLALAVTVSLAACSAGKNPAASPGTTASYEPSGSPDTPPPSAAPPQTLLTAENFPRLDGSTATIPLGEAVVAAVLGIPRGDAAAYINFSGTNNAFFALAAAPGDGNTGAYAADVLIVYEPPAETLGQFGDSVEMTAIGRDALVFLVNASNPISNLTTEQLQKIYTGEYTDWSQLGGTPGEILPYQRPQTSGSQTMFTKLVMRDLPLVNAPAGLVSADMGGLIEAIASYDNGVSAIGYNVWYYVQNMKPDPNVKILTIDGAAPNRETIKSGEYPFVNDFFAVIRADEPADSPARILCEWLTGAQAAELIAREGYAELNS